MCSGCKEAFGEGWAIPTESFEIPHYAVSLSLAILLAKLKQSHALFLAEDTCYVLGAGVPQVAGNLLDREICLDQHLGDPFHTCPVDLVMDCATENILETLLKST